MTEAFYGPIESALLECDIDAKLRRVATLREMDLPAGGAWKTMEGNLAPGRPAQPALVHPAEVPRRRLNSLRGRAALVHAIAHIEFNAINLALDAAWRFRGLPASYYRDWLRVAADEARHFGWLQARLADMDTAYGAFPAHNGLWEAAVKTAHDPLVRMALVPRVLEARGLDVTPGMIERLQAAGDEGTVAILKDILDEEVAHVEIGSRWYHYLCKLRGLDADRLFPELLQDYMQSLPRGPFNFDARRQAGFTTVELDWLNTLNVA